MMRRRGQVTVEVLAVLSTLATTLLAGGCPLGL